MGEKLISKVANLDSRLDSLVPIVTTALASFLPAKYKTLAGIVLVSLSVLAYGLIQFRGWFPDSTTDEAVLSAVAAVGTGLCGIGVVHKALKAPPPESK